MPQRHTETRNTVFHKPPSVTRSLLRQKKGIYEQNNRSNHATHGGAVEWGRQSTEWNRETGGGIHRKEAALRLVGSQIRTRNDAVSFQRACGLRRQGSGWQKRARSHDACPGGRIESARPRD